MKTLRVQLANLVTSFFTRHLVAELGASRHTIHGYRDAFRLFLPFVAHRSERKVVHLTVEDLTPDVILDFLEHLEQRRGNSVRTRNARLAAIRSFFTYSATQDPALAAAAQRVLAIPFKKSTGRLLGYLSEEELRAILDGPDRRTAKGRRDYLAIALLYDTGARVQEICDLCPVDFRLDCLPLVHIAGKGDKQRIVPLLPATAALVRNYLAEISQRQDDTVTLLRNYRGEQMTRSGVAFLLDKYRRIAAERMPSLSRKRISPHTMRHTKAMHLLQAGVSIVTIKDILGHAHLKTVEVYVQADLEMKRKAMETASTPVTADSIVYKRDPDLLHWLEQL